jgi:hypothetical protein
VCVDRAVASQISRVTSNTMARSDRQQALLDGSAQAYAAVSNDIAADAYGSPSSTPMASVGGGDVLSPFHIPMQPLIDGHTMSSSSSSSSSSSHQYAPPGSGPHDFSSSGGGGDGSGGGRQPRRVTSSRRQRRARAIAAADERRLARPCNHCCTTHATVCVWTAFVCVCVLLTALVYILMINHNQLAVRMTPHVANDDMPAGGVVVVAATAPPSSTSSSSAAAASSPLRALWSSSSSSSLHQ